MLKMENIIFTPFRQKRKNLCIRKGLGTLFRPESQKSDFPTFGSQKNENDYIFRFWGAFAAKNAPERKSWPKSEKSGFGCFGLQKRAQNLTFFTVLRLERK